MKTVQTALVTACIVGSALTAATQSASAQAIYDPWSGQSYDVTDCYAQGYNSCYVDSVGEIYGSYEYDPPTYGWDDESYYTPLNPANNYYAPDYGSSSSYAPSSSYTPYPSPSDSHESFINYIWE